MGRRNKTRGSDARNAGSKDGINKKKRNTKKNRDTEEKKNHVMDKKEHIMDKKECTVDQKKCYMNEDGRSMGEEYHDLSDENENSVCVTCRTCGSSHQLCHSEIEEMRKEYLECHLLFLEDLDENHHIIVNKLSNVCDRSTEEYTDVINIDGHIVDPKIGKIHAEYCKLIMNLEHTNFLNGLDMDSMVWSDMLDKCGCYTCMIKNPIYMTNKCIYNMHYKQLNPVQRYFDIK